MLLETDIRAVWDEILPGILSIHKKNPWNDWRPEDIYAACSRKEAMLFTQEGIPAGKSFMVVLVDVKPRTLERVLHIWIAYSPEHLGALYASDTLSELALNNRCSAIEFVTDNPKVKEHGAKFGYTKSAFILRKELEPKEQSSQIGVESLM